MPIPEQVLNLVRRFESNFDEYVTRGYKETPVRRDFIDPLFRALGWDIDNQKGMPETTREVLHEDSIKVGGALKAPDYCFRAGGERKFFVEAKRPFEKIGEAPEWAFQLRRYGWSAKVPFSILTDFEELAVYDCRYPPSKEDHTTTARVNFFRYAELPERWDELEAVFSRDAVLSGKFDAYAASQKVKKGTAEVDDAFLGEIEGWRASLARNIALRNELSVRDLNFAVQQIIDRIVFLRICEDRGIELYGRLLDAASGEGVYGKLCELFLRADDRYNSGLFHFRREKRRTEAPDSLTLQLHIDDKPLREIIRHLYYPDSPYEFSVFSTDILGQVYEQFLGSVIRLTEGGRAIVEEKPEIKKAGGIFYTPAYVTQYIARSALAPITRGATPGTVSNLKILDPACGSGSFLIQAFQHLLDWHLDYYLSRGPEKYQRQLYQVSSDVWRLTTPEKRRILLNSIYGVDIDIQAVEVTKLSLLLKLMEGESEQTIDNQLRLLQERVLPDLGANIKSGNSLIGPEIYAIEQFKLLSEEERFRINALDWKREFPDIVATGGFDVVIGNPPYRRELDYKHLMDEIALTEFGKRYRSPRMDLWYYFVHRGLELLKPGGHLAFITNSYWTSGTGAEKLIAALKDQVHIDEIFSLGKLKVFRRVAGQHMILRVTKGRSHSPTLLKVVAPSSRVSSAEPFVRGTAPIPSFTKKAEELFRSGKVDLQRPDTGLLQKLDALPRLNTYGIVRQGIAENPATINAKTNRAFRERWVVGQGVFMLTPKEVEDLQLGDDEQELLRPYHDLVDLSRYWLADPPSRVLIYSTKQTCPDIKQYPALHRHLVRFRPIMEKRRETQNGRNAWWHLHWPRDEEIWKASKVMAIQMAARPSFVVGERPVYVPFSVNVFVPHEGRPEHLYYFMAILNSRLLWKWFQHYAKRRGVGLEINGNVLGLAPIRKLDFASAADRRRHDAIVQAAGDLLQARRSEAAARTAHDRNVQGRRAAALDDHIDQLMYDLHDLSPDEVAEVTGATQ